MKNSKERKDDKEESRRRFKGGKTRKQRAFLANSDSESSESFEEEVEKAINLAMMAIDDESESEEDMVSSLSHKELKVFVSELLGSKILYHLY